MWDIGYICTLSCGFYHGTQNFGAQLEAVLWLGHHVKLFGDFRVIGDLRQDCKGGFQKGVIPGKEINHMMGSMTSEDYTSQHDLELSEALAHNLEVH